jgi:hypothetical protein
LRVDFNDRHMGRISFGGRRSYLVGAGVHWAVGGPEVTFGMPPDEQVELIVQANAKRGTGYNELIAGGVVYQLAPWDRVVGHAGGPNATILRPNTRLFGIAIAYAGPSQRPRGVEGEIRGPHHKFGSAWYPPISELDELLLVARLRAMRKHGLTADEVWGHSEINTAKSDPFPLDMEEIRRQVADDRAWEQAVNDYFNP